MGYVLCAAFAIAACSALGSLGLSVSVAIDDRTHPSQPPGEHDAGPTIAFGTHTALSRVAAKIVRLADSPVTKNFDLVDDLADPGTELFAAIQDEVFAGLRTRGFAVVDLRLSSEARARLADPALEKERMRAMPGDPISQKERMMYWHDALLQSEGELHVRTGHAMFRNEKRPSVDSLPWHVDTQDFTTTLVTDGNGTQIYVPSRRPSPAMVRNLDFQSESLLDSFVTRNDVEGNPTTERVHEVAHRYNETVSSGDPRLPDWFANPAEGSIIAEEGELVVMLNPFDRTPDRISNAGIIHRRPAEAIEARRAIWVTRGEVRTWQPMEQPSR